jgi:hypothetical protein
MSGATVPEVVQPAKSAGNRHVFVIGIDGELLSWSPGAPAAVPAAVLDVVRDCIAPLAAEACSFAEFVLVLDERFNVQVVRNATTGPVSYAVVIDEFC